LFFLSHDAPHTRATNTPCSSFSPKRSRITFPRSTFSTLTTSKFYLGLLIVYFLLSLSKRHQRATWGYTLAFIGFGFITIYMTVAAFSPARSFSSLSENKYIQKDECWIVPWLSCQVVSVKNPQKPGKYELCISKS